MTTDIRTAPATTDRVLSFMESFYAVNGYPAPIREIQEGCEISSSSVVSYHLAKLIRYGRVLAIRRTDYANIYMPAKWREIEHA